jgi:uncharacterized damage-inducible protein DinB
MNADAIRNIYEYHFTINRKIWDRCVTLLTQEQFVEKKDYSVGSVRNQVVHMQNIDDRWFSGLRGEPVPGFAKFEEYTDRDQIRAMWDGVEQRMRDYLGKLTDDMVFSQPFIADKDESQLWQILHHVANHGTDHRSQLLVLLNQHGVETFPQDYFFFMIGRM